MLIGIIDDFPCAVFYKNTEISSDIPEDAKEELTKTLGQWQVGAIYIYDDRTVDYQNAVRESLTAVGLCADEYTYEFVSGLPGIRYPVAVVFDESTARFIIPAELSTSHAFAEGSEAMEYTAPPSDTAGEQTDIRDGFPVYHFQKVAKASRSSTIMGLGGGIGISPKYMVRNLILKAVVLGALGFGLAGIFILIKRRVRKK